MTRSVHTSEFRAAADFDSASTSLAYSVFRSRTTFRTGFGLGSNRSAASSTGALGVSGALFTGSSMVFTGAGTSSEHIGTKSRENLLRARVREFANWLHPPIVTPEPEPVIDTSKFVSEAVSAVSTHAHADAQGQYELIPITRQDEPVRTRALISVFEERFNAQYDPQEGSYPDPEMRKIVFSAFQPPLAQGGKYYDLCRACLRTFRPSQAEEFDTTEEDLAALGAYFDKHFMKKKRRVA